MTTLTRETLLNAKPRCEAVEVPGWGAVYLRDISNLKASQRASRMFDANGKMMQETFDLRFAHQIIDQVVSEDGTPLFTNDEATAIAEVSQSQLAPLLAAIDDFNGRGASEKKDEPADSSES